MIDLPASTSTVFHGVHRLSKDFVLSGCSSRSRRLWCGQVHHMGGGEKAISIVVKFRLISVLFIEYYDSPWMTQ